MKQIPSTDLFVIHTDATATEGVLRKLVSYGEVEELKGSSAILLHVTQPNSDSKATWQRLRKRLGSGAMVQPVLLDERGHPHYPTGDVSVRFHEALSDEQLRQFAASHEMKVRDRNEFVPEQACFRPLEPERVYIPDLVEGIATNKLVRMAWANTLSQYERVQSKA